MIVYEGENLELGPPGVSGRGVIPPSCICGRGVGSAIGVAAPFSYSSSGEASISGLNKGSNRFSELTIFSVSSSKSTSPVPI